MKAFASVHDTEHSHGVTWHQLVELEPELHQLLYRSRMAGAACRCPADVARIFSPLRNELAGLVGFQAKRSSHAVLNTIGAYEVAYWKLYHAVTGLLPAVCGRSG
jgi:hypothetical protein